jgi:hypothetical protein
MMLVLIRGILPQGQARGCPCSRAGSGRERSPEGESEADRQRAEARTADVNVKRVSADTHERMGPHQYEQTSVVGSHLGVFRLPAATLGAVLDLLPTTGPLLSPGKRTPTDNANLAWKQSLCHSLALLIIRKKREGSLAAINHTLTAAAR